MKLGVIGGGGLGANAAGLLVEQGHDVLLVDNDKADDKFFERFIFFQEPKIFHSGRSKTSVIEHVSHRRGKPIQVVHATVDGDFDYSILDDRFIIIAVDTITAREMVEACVRQRNLQFVHIGCNLGSVSIFKSMADVIGEDPAADATTSYDVVPDALTYMVAACRLAEYLVGRTTRVWVED